MQPRPQCPRRSVPFLLGQSSPFAHHAAVWQRGPNGGPPRLNSIKSRACRKLEVHGCPRPSASGPLPRVPKDQKDSRFRAGLKISSENEIFERATHRGPIFCGEIETSRLKFSSEIKNFDRDQKFRSGSNFFDRLGPFSGISREAKFRRAHFGCADDLLGGDTIQKSV